MTYTGKKITRCNKSTIIEAWSLIRGTPVPYGDDQYGEIVALEHSIRKQFDNVKTVPSIVVAQRSDNPIGAFWLKDLVIDNKWRLRFGHRYLSVHRICGNEMYQTFTEIEEYLGKIVKLYENSLVSPDTFLIQDIEFGYLNSFSFQINNFNLSDYFRMQSNFNVQNDSYGLLKFSSSFILKNSDKPTVLHGEISANTGTTDISVNTRFFSRMKVTENTSITEWAKVCNTISDIKSEAKDGFFGFATDKTHKLMGAEYD